MEVTHDLVRQFVKAVRPAETKTKDAVHYGSVVVSGGKVYVKLDGSDLLTPITTTAAVSDGERVTVTIKDHTAIVTGNMSSPSAKDSEVQAQNLSQLTSSGLISAKAYIDNVLSRIEDIEIGNADVEHLNALKAEVNNLYANFADISNADIENLKASTAKIDQLMANVAKIENIDAGKIEALQADIRLLRSHTGTFTRLSAAEFNAIKANIDTLNARNAEIAFANIDFANIGEATFEKFYSNHGIIKDVYTENSTITGYLVGVTIKGDLIEANTLKADKLVIRGEDGLYYKLNVSADGTKPEGVTDDELQNALHGSNIIANTITAEKISVSDLIAFDATIGGFVIGPTKRDDGTEEGITNSIHSYAKPTVAATSKGIYMDSDGQFNVGDSNNFIKFFKDETDGDKYKLQITADSLKLKAGSTEKTVEQVAQDAANTKIDTLEVGAKNLIRNSDDLVFESYMFGTQMLDDIISAQNSIIEACDALTGIPTVVTPRAPVTKPDFEDVLDDIIGTDSTGQNGVINRINDLLGGESQ